MVKFTWALALTVLLPFAGATRAQDDLSLWLAAVQEHHAGKPDNSAREIAGWSTPELQAVIAAARKHARLLDKTRQAEANRILLRGAVLHADIATLIPDHMISGFLPEKAIVVGDGQQRTGRYPTVHWTLGRALLDVVAPTPASEPEVLIWYRGSSSYLLRTHTLSEALPHLERARQIFPADAEILLDSAYLHEKLASSQIQAAVKSIDPSRGFRLGVDSPRTELGRAERFFRQALTVDPAKTEARVRLGRIVGQLGRHREAIAELREAIAAGLAGESLYYAELFLGREEESLGNRAAARESFERASKLYPLAQSPRLALSQLARQSGDRAGALRALQPVSELPVDARMREDPWWSYFDVH